MKTTYNVARLIIQSRSNIKDEQTSYNYYLEYSQPLFILKNSYFSNI